MEKLRPTFIALLRGINVSGRNRISMGDLRSLCEDIGWGDVQTYIQSGNLVFRAAGRRVSLEGELEEAISRRFGLSIPVIVREAAKWPAYVQGNPFSQASRAEPNLVMLALSKERPRPDSLTGLKRLAVGDERVGQVGDALWIHYCAGVGKSKLSPGLLDRIVGSPVTTRNWRTVLKLDEMARTLAT